MGGLGFGHPLDVELSSGIGVVLACECALGIGGALNRTTKTRIVSESGGHWRDGMTEPLLGAEIVVPWRVAK